MMVIIEIRLGLESMTRSYLKLNRIPFAVKLYIGFALFGFLLMGLISLNAYIKRPKQMQSVNDTLRMYKNDDIRMYNSDCITDTIVEVITTCNTYTLLTVHLL